jgi:hypothetical protein
MVTELIEISYLASMLKVGQFNFSPCLFTKFLLHMKVKADFISLLRGKYDLSKEKNISIGPKIQIWFTC